jgi:hypothetical protein
MAVRVAQGTWNISVRAQTLVGPWAFSLHVFAISRAEAESAAISYLRGLLPPSTALSVTRALFVYDYFEASGPRVGLVKASSGDHVAR